MKRFRRYSGSEFKRRDPSQTSIERAAAEAERQRELREMFNGNWYLMHRQARIEREAAEAREGGRDDGKA